MTTLRRLTDAELDELEAKATDVIDSSSPPLLACWLAARHNFRRACKAETIQRLVAEVREARKGR